MPTYEDPRKPEMLEFFMCSSTARDRDGGGTKGYKGQCMVY